MNEVTFQKKKKKKNLKKKKKKKKLSIGEVDHSHYYDSIAKYIMIFYRVDHE